MFKIHSPGKRYVEGAGGGENGCPRAEIRNICGVAPAKCDSVSALGYQPEDHADSCSRSTLNSGSPCFHWRSLVTSALRFNVLSLPVGLMKFCHSDATQNGRVALFRQNVWKLAALAGRDTGRSHQCARSNAFIGSSVNLTVSFDNAGSGSETGYGPIIDVVLPVNGADGGASPDGLNTTGPATYLGTPITTIELTFPNGGGGTGSVNHPFFKDNAGNPLVVTGNAGDKLVVMQLPFGSFTPDQPAAAVDLPLTMSNLADLNAPLTIRSHFGFQFGIDPLDNPGSDPSLVSDSPSNSSTWSVSQAVNPILTRLTKQNLAPESETATVQFSASVPDRRGSCSARRSQTLTYPICCLPEIVYLGNGSLSVAPSLSPVIISSPLTSGPQKRAERSI